jgi:hypothetical protein
MIAHGQHQKMKLVCLECGWRGNELTVLRALNPSDPTKEILGCPKCASVETMLHLACDEPGCWKLHSCEIQTPSGYRMVCSEHYFTLERPEVPPV